jgi:hypothetical protein
MRIARISSLFAATVLAAGVSVVVTPSAFADGVQDCMNGGNSAGLKAPDSASACSLAKGGDTADCASQMKNAPGSTATDESAAGACGKAAPPAPPASG